MRSAHQHCLVHLLPQMHMKPAIDGMNPQPSAVRRGGNFRGIRHDFEVGSFLAGEKLPDM